MPLSGPASDVAPWRGLQTHLQDRWIRGTNLTLGILPSSWVSGGHSGDTSWRHTAPLAWPQVLRVSPILPLPWPRHPPLPGCSQQLRVGLPASGLGPPNSPPQMARLTSKVRALHSKGSSDESPPAISYQDLQSRSTGPVASAAFHLLTRCPQGSCSPTAVSSLLPCPCLYPTMSTLVRIVPAPSQSERLIFPFCSRV